MCRLLKLRIRRRIVRHFMRISFGSSWRKGGGGLPNANNYGGGGWEVRKAATILTMTTSIGWFGWVMWMSCLLELWRSLLVIVFVFSNTLNINQRRLEPNGASIKLIIC